jgi:hypothetical protein
VLFPAGRLFCADDFADLFNSDAGVVETDDGRTAAAPRQTVGSFLGDLNSGFGLFTNYAINMSVLPGWGEDIADVHRYEYSPWGDKFNFTDIFESGQPFGAEINAYVALDIQISASLHFWQSAKFSVPDMQLTLQDFYGEYQVNHKAYLKFGKYDYSWGFSPNFPYTNLLARIPNKYDKDMKRDGDWKPGDMYLLRFDVPIGIGGIQAVALTRANIYKANSSQVNRFAFGMKFNLATQIVDVDFGTLYFKGYVDPEDGTTYNMPWRSFISAKGTIFKRTEVYSEVLLAVTNENGYVTGDSKTYFSTNFGFYQDFFSGRLKLNGEFFYSDEPDSSYYRKANPIEDLKESFPFLQGANIAFNVDFRPPLIWSFRLATKFVYNIEQNSGEIIPGFSFEPFQHLRFYFAAPMVIGEKLLLDKDGNVKKGAYYKNNDDKFNRPFALLFVVSISGSFDFKHY